MRRETGEGRSRIVAILVAGLTLVAVALLWDIPDPRVDRSKTDRAVRALPKGPRAAARGSDLRLPPLRRVQPIEVDAAAEAASVSPSLEELQEILEKRNALEGEAVVQVGADGDRDELRKALSRHGLRILDEHDGSGSFRVAYDRLEDLESALRELDPEDYRLDANYSVSVPHIPQPEAPTNPGQQIQPFGSGSLEWLGITGDNASWGEGVTIAVLDTGVDGHSAFRSDQVRRVNLSDSGLSHDDAFGHGTAVASLAVGSHPDAPGVAPAADLLSYRVTNEHGLGDAFTLSSAIYEAVDAGADIINISLGSYGDSIVMRQAVEYAAEHGIPIVAAAGNDGLDRLAYPAAYDEVVSVGAVDALGKHVFYSNSSDRLSLSAPGAGIAAAWPGEQLVQFSGTSASAPYVSGALAAIMSEAPGLDGVEASELLVAYANEAGRPGADADFGAGIIDIGRVMDRDVPGIYDVAVASLTFANPSSFGIVNVIDVAVQNRGTESLHDVHLQVDTGSGVQTFSIPFLRAGEVVVRRASLDSFRVRDQGSIQLRSTASLSDPTLQERNTANNRQATLITTTQ